MPNAPDRDVIVVTAEIADAIDAAAPWYPGESRADILGHLVRLGAERLVELHGVHRSAVFDRAGRYPGVYTEGSLDALRGEWGD